MPKPKEEKAKPKQQEASRHANQEARSTCQQGKAANKAKLPTRRSCQQGEAEAAEDGEAKESFEARTNAAL